MTQPTPPLDLDALTALADAATPEPWMVIDHNEGENPPRPLWGVVNDAFLTPPDDDDTPWIAVEIHVGDRADAEFIAASRAAVPALVAEVERLRAEVHTVECDKLRAEVKRLRESEVGQLATELAEERTYHQRTLATLAQALAEVDRLTRLLGPDPTQSGPITDRAGIDDLDDSGDGR